MSSPVATIADALMAFILSLLRDPNAAAEFKEDPEGSMAANGVQGACMADLRAVKPVIYDHPEVEPRPPTPSVLGSTTEPNEVVGEIVRIMNQFTTVDARSTMVDQSVNQNIWTQGGDVTQLFDQEAIIASGNNAVAAGADASTHDEDLDVTVGDVTAGNDTYNDSFNDADVSVPQPGSAAPVTPSDGGTETTGAESQTVAAAESGEVAVPQAASTPASLPEPADYLESDLTAASGDTYATEAAAVPVEDTAVDAPVEE
ncbi:MAG: IniB N-terminal domain-containing protein [Salinibacterium sp.]|nr:IniB N-terminal domain-containing protein [Salinibacterium sp.]MBF0673085.1 IniB N-terminal domain-containing protein [Salinibacterium sp.]